jgi:hypothetical protein
VDEDLRSVRLEAEVSLPTKWQHLSSLLQGFLTKLKDLENPQSILTIGFRAFPSLDTIQKMLAFDPEGLLHPKVNGLGILLAGDGNPINPVDPMAKQQ